MSSNIKYLAIAGLVVFLSGCSMRPSNWSMMYLDNGFPYMLPTHNARYLIIPEGGEEDLKNNGIYGCSKGDAMWVSEYDADELINSKSYGLLSYYFRDGLAGCAQPMTDDQVIAFYQNSQNQSKSTNWGDAMLKGVGVATDVLNNDTALKYQQADQLGTINQGMGHQIERQSKGHYFRPGGL